MINFTLLMTALVTSLEMKEDTGECQLYSTEDECLDEISIYDSTKTTCLWDNDEQVCLFQNHSAFHMTTTVVTVVIAIIIAVPIRVVLYAVFEFFLRAPTQVSDDSNNSDNGKSFRNLFKQQSVVPAVLRRASRFINVIADNAANVAKTTANRLGLSKKSTKVVLFQPTVKLPKSIKTKRSIAVDFFNQI
jgi:hypothetical protein